MCKVKENMSKRETLINLLGTVALFAVSIIVGLCFINT